MASELIFQQLFEAESCTYTYLLADSRTGEAVLIDPVLETIERDMQLIRELELKLLYVLETHLHADHVTSAGEIRKRLKIKTAAPQNAKLDCADLHLVDGDEIQFGGEKLTVLETPGHTDASVSFLCRDMVMTGDSLLIRGTGRTDFQGGSAAKLYESITEKLFQLPPQTRVYPGHDYKGVTSSTIEAEMKNNPRVGAGKTKAEFIQIMSELNLSYPKQIDRALPANKACGLLRS